LPPAGYSGTPLPKKLGVKQEHQLLLLGAPKGFDKTLGSLPAGVQVRRDLRKKSPVDVAILFCKSCADLEKRFAAVAERLDKAGGLWVAWPKKSSGVKTDLSDGFVREFGLSTGLVDNKVCAVDETWSGLRFVYRLKDR
jgi:hypothetical protein